MSRGLGMNHATRIFRFVGATALALGTVVVFFACESPLLKEIREASLAPAVLSPIISLSVALPNGNDGQTEVPLDNGTTFPFPSKYLGAAASPVLFRVSNTGTGELLLTGEDKVQLAGEDGDSFEVSQPPGRIDPGTYEQFSIDFTPSRLGPHTASVKIVSNDPITPIVTFEITTEATATPIPVIQLLQGSTLIPQDTSEYDFGNVIADGTGNISSAQVVFTILNNGSAHLDVSSIDFGIGDSNDFVLFNTEPRSVAPGNSADFGVSFDPVSMGEKSVELRINHNDQENNPTVFSLSGTGVAPKIAVEGASGEILHNGLIDFGTVLTGRIAELEVTVHNDGTANLHLTNLPLVVSGTDGSFFSLVNQPASTIAPGAQTSFSIQFTKRYEDQSSPRTARVQIAHDDVLGPNSPFLINLSAQALEWSGTRQIDIVGGRNEILYHHTAHPGVFSIHDYRPIPWLPTQIRFGRSDDGGATWDNHTIDSSGNSPRGHMNAERIAIIYKSGDDLYYTTSTDHGQTWSNKQHIAPNVSFHDITGSDHSTRDLVFVSYRDTITENVMFLKSEDGGATWEPAKTIVASNNDVGRYSAIATERLGTYVFVSYWNHSTKAVEVVGSDDGGANWIQPRVVDSSVAPSISKTDVAVHSSQLGPIVVAYTDTANNLAFARCSSFHTFFYGFEQDRWSTAVIDSNVDLSADLAIAYNSVWNDVYIAYRDYTHGYLYVMKSDDGGVSWLPRKAVDTFGDAGRYPSITVHSNAYNDLVFIGHTDLGSFDYRIVKSKTGGSEW